MSSRLSELVGYELVVDWVYMLSINASGAQGAKLMLGSDVVVVSDPEMLIRICEDESLTPQHVWVNRDLALVNKARNYCWLVEHDGDFGYKLVNQDTLDVGQDSPRWISEANIRPDRDSFLTSLKKQVEKYTES